MSGGSVCPWRTEGNERSGASAPASGITIGLLTSAAIWSIILLIVWSIRLLIAEG